MRQFLLAVALVASSAFALDVPFFGAASNQVEHDETESEHIAYSGSRHAAAHVKHKASQVAKAARDLSDVADLLELHARQLDSLDAQGLESEAHGFAGQAPDVPTTGALGHEQLLGSLKAVTGRLHDRQINSALQQNAISQAEKGLAPSYAKLETLVAQYKANKNVKQLQNEAKPELQKITDVWAQIPSKLSSVPATPRVAKRHYTWPLQRDFSAALTQFASAMNKFQTATEGTPAAEMLTPVYAKMNPVISQMLGQMQQFDAEAMDAVCRMLLAMQNEGELRVITGPLADGMGQALEMLGTRAGAEQSAIGQIGPTFDINSQVPFSMTSPLVLDGSDYPCKGLANQTFSTAPVATLRAGSSLDVKLAGSVMQCVTRSTRPHARSGGGSCQFSLSYDQGKTFGVIHSIVGGCPLAMGYSVPIPRKLPATNKALFAWSWYNREGNREQYQNCAVVRVESKAIRPLKLPAAFNANVQGPTQCRTPEGEVVFPNLGDSINYGGTLSKSSPATRMSPCDVDQSTFVTLGGAKKKSTCKHRAGRAHVF